MFNSSLFISGAVQAVSRIRTWSEEYFDSDDEDQNGPFGLRGRTLTKIPKSTHGIDADGKPTLDSAAPTTPATHPPSLVAKVSPPQKPSFHRNRKKTTQLDQRSKRSSLKSSSTRSTSSRDTSARAPCSRPLLVDLVFTADFLQAVSGSTASAHTTHPTSKSFTVPHEPFSLGQTLHSYVSSSKPTLPPLQHFQHKVPSAPSAAATKSVTSLQELLTSKVECHAEVLTYRELLTPAELTQSHLDELTSGGHIYVISTTTSTTDTDEALQQKFQTTTITDFGPGTELEVLTECALQEAFRAKTDASGDTASVCIGVVSTRNVYHTSETFMSSIVDGEGDTEASQALADAMAAAMSAVYCAVHYAPCGQKRGTERKYCVVWEAGAAVPLAVLSIRQKQQCRVCFDAFGTAEGLTCAHKCGTFTCWDCLLQSYKMATQPGAIQGQSNTEGELLCSDIQCKCPVKMVDLLRSNASEAVLKAYEDFKIHILTTKRVTEALREQEGQIRGEYARIEQIKDADEKAAAKMRLKIVDEVLTLRCPRCSTAFMDFEGCFALRCSSNSCRCGFCAWCLKDCGGSKETHEHVQSCPENPGKRYFSTESAFQQHHKDKRIASIRNLLSGAALSGVATEKLKEKAKRDLEDLGIQLSDVFATTGVGAIKKIFQHEERTFATHDAAVLPWHLFGVDPDYLVYRDYHHRRLAPPAAGYLGPPIPAAPIAGPFLFNNPPQPPPLVRANGELVYIHASQPLQRVDGTFVAQQPLFPPAPAMFPAIGRGNRQNQPEGPPVQVPPGRAIDNWGNYVFDD